MSQPAAPARRQTPPQPCRNAAHGCNPVSGHGRGRCSLHWAVQLALKWAVGSGQWAREPAELSHVAKDHLPAQGMPRVADDCPTQASAIDAMTATMAQTGQACTLLFPARDRHTAAEVRLLAAARSSPKADGSCVPRHPGLPRHSPSFRRAAVPDPRPAPGAPGATVPEGQSPS